MKRMFIDIAHGSTFKTIASLLASAITFLTGGEYVAFTVLLVLTFADGITGFYKAWYHGEVTSVRFRDKMKHYIAYCIVIICMQQVLLIAPYVRFLVDFVVLYFAAGEIISIMENLEEAGIPMPTYVKNKLMEMSKRKEYRYKKLGRRKSDYV